MDAPPLLVSFDSLLDFQKAATDHAEWEYSQLLTLFEKRLPPVTSKTSLAILFGYSPQFIGAMCQNAERYYRTFYIYKGKKRRRIDSPKVALKVIQKWFGFHLAKQMELADYVVGFVPGKSTADGALIHCGAEWVFSTDVEDFFPSISETKVKDCLMGIGYTTQGAEVISKLTCLNGFLAQGSPSSPVISNLCFKDCDKRIQAFCLENGLRYSRYADDLVVSGKGEIPEMLESVICGVLEKEGWKHSRKKTFIARAPFRLKVYGLLVNGKVPRLTKGYRRRLRAIRYNLENDRTEDSRKQEALGHLAYAKGIEKFAARASGAGL